MASASDIVPGVYAVTWREGRRHQPGRWVQREVLELVELHGRERAEFREHDPLRTGQPVRSSCGREALARWAEHVLLGPVPRSSIFSPSLPPRRVAS